jgi:hypothetical protein
MHGLSGPAFWLLRRLTGFRLYHLLALTLASTVALGGMAVPFWWLGEQADAAIGPLGFAIAAIAYVSAGTLLLAAAVIVVARVLRGRIRRLLAY